MRCDDLEIGNSSSTKEPFVGGRGGTELTARNSRKEQLVRKVVARTFCADPDFRCETHSEPKSESAPDRRVTIWVTAEVVVTEMAIRVPLRNVAVRLRALLQPVLARVSTVRLVLAPEVVLPVSGHRLAASEVLARIRKDRLQLRLEQIELLHFDEVFLK